MTSSGGRIESLTTMAVPIPDAEMQSGTWLHGRYGASYGVCITESNIVVKFGSYVQGQREKETINFVRRMCPSIPVPEVYYTWKSTWQDRLEIEFIAMSLVPGAMLRDVWPNMEPVQKETVLKQLKKITQLLRQIPVPGDAVIGAIDGIGRAADSRGGSTELGGPFPTEADLNEWLLAQIHPDSLKYHSSFYVETIRSCLQRNVTKHKLRFTHEDLGMHNILVDGDKITAIIDWEYGGWYPEYWEYVKMIQYCRDTQFRCWARECWEDEKGMPILYDQEFVIDQMLDSQIKNGERVIKRPR